MKFLSWLTSFFSQFGELQKIGFRASVTNNGLMLHKQGADLKVEIHEHIEPFSRFEKYLDFECQGACVVFESKREELFELVSQHFPYNFQRGPFIFSFHSKMDVDDPRLIKSIKAIHHLFESE